MEEKSLRTTHNPSNIVQAGGRAFVERHEAGSWPFKAGAYFSAAFRNLEIREEWRATMEGFRV